MLKGNILHSNEPVILIDGSSFLYRAFYAYPDLKRSDGFPTNAIYIVLRMLLKLLKEENPSYMGFFMDGRGPTFRHEIYDEYKAQRPMMPEGLSSQVQPLLQAVHLLGIPGYVAEGLEADDLIAGYTQRLKQEHPVVIVASDKDLKQLLDEQVYLWDPSNKSNKPISAQDFREETGIDPAQWPDFQALVGDSSDNIPGIPGVGPKTALNWLRRFFDLEELEKNLDQLKPKEQEKLKAHLEDVYLYRKLTRLKLDCLQEAGLKDLQVKEPDGAGLVDFLHQYEFKSLLEELPPEMQTLSREQKQESREQAADLEAQHLPYCSGRDCGVFPLETGFLVALESKEWQVHDADWLRERVQGCKKYFFFLKESLKTDSAWLKEPVSLFLDISLGAYLLNPEERDYGYERIFNAYAPEVRVHKENKALAALRIGQLMEERLKSAGLDRLLLDLEMPLIPVLCRMESAGVSIDLEAFREFLEEVQKRLQELTEQIYIQAGREFNIRSTQQTAQVLFQELGLKPKRKTSTGAYSTSNVVLEAMRQEHPIVELILEYRTLEKLRSTYLEPLPRKVDSSGRLHTTFNQTATATGRLSSSNPNLQNIPIRGEFGPKMRACFTASQGKLLVGADYSQIELRVLAHMSKDPNLLEAFAGHEDIHQRTAGLLWDKDVNQVTRDERRKAKTVNFGLLYGMGPQKLARELNISMEEAKQFIQVYFSKLKKVRAFYQSVEDQAQEQGYVTTLSGRRRLLPDINSRNENLAQQARRTAVNTVIQGSAADVIKKAMLAVDGDEKLSSLGAVLLLQVHDELLLEVDEARARDAGERVSGIMSGVETFEVPLVVEWGVGKNWAQAHD